MARLSQEAANDFRRVRLWFVGCNFHHWDDDEFAFFHARMGYLQAGFTDLFITIHKNIQIQRPGPVANCPGSVAPKFLLDPEQPQQQVARPEISLEDNHRVDKTRLFGKPHRLRRVE